MMPPRFLYYVALLLPFAQCQDEESVNGGWTEWETDSPCCAGKYFRIRSCTNPAPSGNGTYCEGPSRFPFTCSPDDVELCPLNGGWSDWEDDSICCDGKVMRVRTCTSPAPARGGESCAGPSSFEFTCDVDECGNEYSDWETVKQNCCWGLRLETRSCLGGTCVQPLARTVPCDEGAVSKGECYVPSGGACELQSEPPVDSSVLFFEGQSACCDMALNPETCLGWSPWSDWSDCCGAEQSRSRVCAADSCPPGDVTQSRPCAPDTCERANDGWSEWVNGPCCGGILLRTRTCLEPPCSGPVAEETSCDRIASCYTPAGTGATCVLATSESLAARFESSTDCCQTVFPNNVETCTSEAEVDSESFLGPWTDWGTCCLNSQTRVRACLSEDISACEDLLLVEERSCSPNECGSGEGRGGGSASVRVVGAVVAWVVLAIKTILLLA